MAIEKVISFFEERGAAEKVKRFTVSSATVELAAAALRVEGARIAKTMSFLSPEGGAILVVTAGDTKIDNPKFKAQFRTKAKMIPPELLPELVGHEMGGVCPFAVNPGCRVYLDESLKRFGVVYPAAGDAASAVELTIPELETFSGFDSWVDVCKERTEAAL